MNSDIKEIIQILSAALAPITAIVALGIAYRQYRLERIKFRHELYEKRLAIFNSTMTLLSIIMRKADVDMSDLIKFIQETNQSYFLLGKDIATYLDVIYKNGVDFHFQNQKLHDSSLPVGDERTRLAEENTKLLKWFTNQLLVAREKFAEHLGLDK
jgi:hypothetical protein